jgi:hypothetical protein
MKLTWLSKIKILKFEHFSSDIFILTIFLGDIFRNTNQLKNKHFLRIELARSVYSSAFFLLTNIGFWHLKAFFGDFPGIFFGEGIHKWRY